MSNKGRIAKQATGHKAIEILAWILDQANSHKTVVLTEDWGGFSLTVSLGVESQEDGRITPTTHTHIGNFSDDASIDQFIDNFHSTVTGKGGLSWA